MTPLPDPPRVPAPSRRARPLAAAGIGLRDRRYPPLRVAIAVQTLTQSGLDAAALLEATGLDAQALADPDVRVSSLQLFTVARNAVRLGCRSESGLRIGLRYHVSCYGMAGYAFLCSSTMREAFDATMRFHRLCSSLLSPAWIETPEAAVWYLPPREETPLPDLDPALFGFVRDMALAACLTIYKDIMGSWCMPSRVRFTGPAPAHVEMLARAFECPLEFEHPRNEVHYPASWLDRAPQLANPITAAQVSQACARMLDEFKWQSGYSRRVYHELTSTPGRFPEIETVARTLNMTSRTLRRKLEAEGTTYSGLLDSVRGALAQDYLATTRLGIEDVAELLGFGDATSFRRAFKRWTGLTPAACRG
ncbi:MAG: AraC family transcriptional regulator [Burkholderiales bacterium]|nr:helix-turn-helix transcriptional regulator [Burkholderiales bacterium]MDE1928586.1 AraC family transcriptional regulator [Burkholderiales bacterium]MDE2159836.1 AraC family transcriptional regulator [Burkholderiales bacterium]MDE2502471.1 AraC family transcriptional regulator [Burkholderiales bacterium]